jgi:hypothetical protein
VEVQLWITVTSQPATPMMMEEQCLYGEGLAILSLNASFRVAVQVIALEHCFIALSHQLQQLLTLILSPAHQAALETQYTSHHYQEPLAFPTVYSRMVPILGQMDQFVLIPRQARVGPSLFHPVFSQEIQEEQDQEIST